MSDDLPLIGVIAKLELKPDDIVVLKTRDHITAETARRIEMQVSKHLPHGTALIILDGLDIQVLSPTDSREVAGH